MSKKTKKNQKKPLSKLKHLFLYLSLFFLSILLGAILKTLKQKPTQLIPPLFFQARKQAQKSPQKSLKYFKMATNWHLKDFQHKYSKLDLNPTFPALNSKQQQIYKNIILKKIYKNPSKNYPNLIARLNYELGLALYPKNPNLTQAFFEVSVASGPYWTPLQIELANFYLKNGSTQKAKNTLETCSKFETFEDTCKNYLKNRIEQNSPYEVGFLQSEIYQEIR